MSWAKLLGDRRVTALPASKAELDNLRPIVARCLKDAAAANLSADAQFVMAYMLSAYFDGCRIKRNECEYVSAGGISDTDAQGLLTTVQRFATDCEAWIRRRHPALV